jgi:hypothetical protein
MQRFALNPQDKQALQVTPAAAQLPVHTEQHSNGRSETAAACVLDVQGVICTALCSWCGCAAIWHCMHAQTQGVAAVPLKRG